MSPVPPEEPDRHRDPGDAGDPAERPVEHDDTGLDLARSIARSLARPGARRRTTGGGTPS